MPTPAEHEELLRGLGSTPKRIPVSYLYDARGSSLYEDITDLPSYYPYNEERNLLRAKADAISKYIPADAVVVELGCGPATKTTILLEALARRHGRFTFAGIDVSQQFLDEARANVDAAMAALKSSGSESPSGASGAAAAPSSTSTHTGSISWEVQTVCADYMSGLREVRRRFPAQTLVLLWLGSSVGNLEDPEARAFFRGVLRITGQRTRVLLATDLWKSRGVLQLAYDDPQGVTAAFIKNGLRHALRTLGCSVPEDDRELPWEYEAIVNAEKRRVEMWVRCNQDLEVIPNKVSLRAGERVFMEISRKFTREDVAAMAQGSGFVLYDRWSSDYYGMQLLVPAEEALRLCWEESDAFFNQLRSWHSIPIEFRHPFSFYYGHLAAFAALKLVEGRAARREVLDVMYSRGIDPMLLDPSLCHDHPEVPAQWPALPALRHYVRETRETTLRFLDTEEPLKGNDDSEARVLGATSRVSLALEHEWMHQETLAYMKAQDDIRAFLGLPHTDSETEGTEGTEGDSSSPGFDSSSDEGSEDALTLPVSLGAVAPADGKASSPGASPGAPSNGERTSMWDGSSAKKRSLGAPQPKLEELVGANGAASKKLSLFFSGPQPLLGLNPKAEGVILSEPVLDVTIPAGPVTVGVQVGPAAPSFGWDNEGPLQGPREVRHALAVSSEPVTVAQFHCFVTCLNGYKRPELWQAADWLFLQKRGQSCPATWTLVHPDPEQSGQEAQEGQQESGGEYWVYDLGRTAGPASLGPRCMRPWREVRDSPVLVSLAEAQAFCKAVGAGAGAGDASSEVRIMTEDEWNRIVQFKPEDELRPDPISAAKPQGQQTEGQGLGVSTVEGRAKGTPHEGARGLLCSHCQEEAASAKGSTADIPAPDPVHCGRTGGPPLEVLQRSVRVGGWEWTSTPFEPFPGFQAMKDYPEYSADFFDGVHYVLKGSSPVTHPAIIRDSFRNFYQRQYPYMFAKFRCCREVPHPASA